MVEENTKWSVQSFMAITVFCWLGVGVGLVHRIRCNFYEPANRTIRNGVLLGQTVASLWAQKQVVPRLGFCGRGWRRRLLYRRRPRW